VDVVDAGAAPQIPALAFSFASWPRAGPCVGVLDFLIPTLAVDHSEPNASPPAEDDLAATGFADEFIVEAAGCGLGAGTEVK
jgi:hypothetical protein